MKKTPHSEDSSSDEFKNFFEYFLYDFMLLAKFLEDLLNKAIKEEAESKLEIHELDDEVEFLNLKDKLMVILDFQGITSEGKVFAQVKNGILYVSAWRGDVKYYREIPLSKDFCLENISLKNGVVTVILKRKKK